MKVYGMKGNRGTEVYKGASGTNNYCPENAVNPRKSLSLQNGLCM